MISGFSYCLSYLFFLHYRHGFQSAVAYFHDRIQQIFDIAVRAFNGRYRRRTHVKPVVFRTCHNVFQSPFA